MTSCLLFRKSTEDSLSKITSIRIVFSWNFWLNELHINLHVITNLHQFEIIFTFAHRFLEKHRLFSKFKARVEEEILVEINQEVKNMRGERIEARVNELLSDLDAEYKDKEIKLEELSEDLLYALHLLQYEDALKISPKIDKLKTDYILNELKAIENDLYTDQIMISHRNGLGDDLKLWEKHPDENVKSKARSLRQAIYKIILQEIGRRYSGFSVPQVSTE